MAIQASHGKLDVDMRMLLPFLDEAQVPTFLVQGCGRAAELRTLQTPGNAQGVHMSLVSGDQLLSLAAPTSHLLARVPEQLVPRSQMATCTQPSPFQFIKHCLPFGTSFSHTHPYGELTANRK